MYHIEKCYTIHNPLQRPPSQASALGGCLTENQILKIINIYLIRHPFKKRKNSKRVENIIRHIIWCPKILRYHPSILGSRTIMQYAQHRYSLLHRTYNKIIKLKFNNYWYQYLTKIWMCIYIYIYINLSKRWNPNHLNIHIWSTSCFYCHLSS